MSDRDGFEHGVPCWVDTWQDEPATRFYFELFGWEIDDGPDYSMARLRGRDAAGFGSPAPEGVDPQWTTYVWVDDADATTAAVRNAGGSVITEPFDALDGGRMAIVADPAGATLGVWAPGEHKGAQVVNEPSAWAMSALYTPDTEAAARFYGEVFGWQTESFGPATMFRLPGFFGGEPTQPVPRDVVAVMIGGDPPRWQAGFWIADAEEAVARAEELGGRVLEPVTSDSVGKNAVLADPAGAEFSITQIVLS
jgi:predicted enzyme related to lactoylglutathione lyase